MNKKIAFTILSASFALLSQAQVSQSFSDDKYRLVGDVGMGLFHTGSVSKGVESSNSFMPYLNASYGNLFARVDTFGVKVLPLAYGHIEFSTRITQEGYKQKDQPYNLTRTSPMPIGISTAQVTPYGAFFVHGFHDTKSGGLLLDVNYGAKFNWNNISMYPQVGVERRSAKYVQHLYGVTAQDVADSRQQLTAFAGAASTSPKIGLLFDYPINRNNSLKLNLRKKWLDRNMSDSPLVSANSQTNVFLAVAHQFD